MTVSETTALGLLVKAIDRIEERQEEQGKVLAVVKDTTNRTEAAVTVLESEMLTVQGQARKSLALHDASDKAATLRQSAMDGDTSAPGWFWYTTPQALALKFPRIALSLLGFSIIAPAALALSLAWFAGPGGGLRILLQHAGVRTIMVPTPEPVTVAPTAGGS